MHARVTRVSMTSMPGYAFSLPMAHSTVDSWRGFSSFTSSPMRACGPYKHVSRDFYGEDERGQYSLHELLKLMGQA